MGPILEFKSRNVKLKIVLKALHSFSVKRMYYLTFNYQHQLMKFSAWLLLFKQR